MTLNELQALLNTTRIPFTHHHWESPPPPPYGVYLTPYTANFAADNITYLQIQGAMVELYTDGKSPDLEAKIEEALTGVDIYFDKGEDYIKEIGLYQVVYEIEV